MCMPKYSTNDHQPISLSPLHHCCALSKSGVVIWNESFQLPINLGLRKALAKSHGLGSAKPIVSEGVMSRRSGRGGFVSGGRVSSNHFDFSLHHSLWKPKRSKRQSISAPHLPSTIDNSVVRTIRVPSSRRAAPFSLLLGNRWLSIARAAVPERNRGRLAHHSTHPQDTNNKKMKSIHHRSPHPQKSRILSVTELPDSIGNMKSLRYLDLSATGAKEIPDSICTLYNLQTLLLSYNRDLAQLPIRIAALENLRHLDIRGTRLKEMPPLQGMTLQTLSDFVLGENGGSRIKELGDFPLLEGSLCISGLENIVDVRDVLEANLKDKKFLSELILSWKGDCDSNDSQKEREVLEALQPHTNLKKLEIVGYRGTVFPDWVGDESFCNMVQVRVWNCKNCCMLPPFGQLPSLGRLQIGGLDRVVGIGDEFCGSSSTTTQRPFRSLEYLEIKEMESWKEWSFSSDRVGQEGGVFPCLKELRLYKCEKLIVGLPDCYLPSMKSIYIVFCDEMVGVCVCPSTQQMITNPFPSLHYIHAWGCRSLESLFGMSHFNQFAKPHLQSLSICYCKKLWQNRMNWDLQSLSSLKELHLNGGDEVDSFPEEGFLPTTLTSLDIIGFGNLKGLNGRAFQHLTSLQRLTIWGCQQVECLPEEGLPLSLSYLHICDCPLLEQRCQRGTGEDWPIIQHIPNIIIEYRPI